MTLIKFNFDYSDFQWYYKNGTRIPLHEIRKGLVCEYLFITLSEEELKQLNPDYISSLGEYILFALDKDIKKGLLPMTTAQFNVLCQELKGVRGFLRQDKKDKKKTYYFVYDEKRMEIIKRNENIEFTNILESQKKVYVDLLQNVSNRYKQSLRDDLKDMENYHKKLFVKSKDCVTSHDTFLTISQMDVIDYSNFKIVKTLLKDYKKLSNYEIGSTGHCIYLDLYNAIKKSKFTKKQYETLNDYINGVPEHKLQNVTLDYGIRKIVKKLS